MVLSALSLAFAHPHVWVDSKSEVMFDDSGRIAAIKHIWVFDEAYSTFATTGLDANRDGKISREELADLAKVNIESLEEFEYFTFVKNSGRRIALDKPVDFWLDHDGKRLTLFFTLPLKSPLAPRTVSLEVADPTFFVAFAFIEKDPVVMSRAPVGCTLRVRRAPRVVDTMQAQTLGESLLGSLRSGTGGGLDDQFANRAFVACA
jgi:ABC-type uncharacterized transport system substrate-binding protein